MNNFLLVALGGAVGSVARYGLGVRLAGANWPQATFAANLLGGLLIGLLAGFLAARSGESSERLRLLLQVGVLGGFTTFSAYSLEAVMMIERRAYGAAGAYALGSVVASLLAVGLGLAVARRAFV
jgi:fluoride exporter